MFRSLKRIYTIRGFHKFCAVLERLLEVLVGSEKDHLLSLAKEGRNQPWLSHHIMIWTHCEAISGEHDIGLQFQNK